MQCNDHDQGGIKISENSYPQRVWIRSGEICTVLAEQSVDFDREKAAQLSRKREEKKEKKNENAYAARSVSGAPYLGMF